MRLRMGGHQGEGGKTSVPGGRSEFCTRPLEDQFNYNIHAL